MATTQTGGASALEIINSGPENSIIIGNSSRNDDVAEVFNANRDTVKTTYEQAMEYARLFVAAPDLLAALDEIIPPPLCGEDWNLPDDDIATITVTFGKLRRARAALAKVKGTQNV